MISVSVCYIQYISIQYMFQKTDWKAKVSRQELVRCLVGVTAHLKRDCSYLRVSILRVWCRIKSQILSEARIEVTPQALFQSPKVQEGIPICLWSIHKQESWWGTPWGGASLKERPVGKATVSLCEVNLPFLRPSKWWIGPLKKKTVELRQCWGFWQVDRWLRGWMDPPNYLIDMWHTATVLSECKTQKQCTMHSGILPEFFWVAGYVIFQACWEHGLIVIHWPKKEWERNKLFV